MAWMVLKWSIFKIVSGDPDLHPRCFKIFSSETSQPIYNVANMSSMVLRWSTAKIVFSDPDLGPKLSPTADIVLT
jgi:hypothetical protein